MCEAGGVVPFHTDQDGDPPSSVFGFFSRQNGASLWLVLHEEGTINN